jgi:7-cyano-7-deazaguanine reductase
VRVKPDTGPGPAGGIPGAEADRVPPIALDIKDAEAVRADVLETFSYQYAGSPAVVEIDTDEFTAVCPWSGLPDFGRVVIRYLPNEHVLELRSLKYYLLSYRPVGIFQEHAANRILTDLVAATAPTWMELELDYRVRGGIHTIVRIRWPKAAATRGRSTSAAEESAE